MNRGKSLSIWWFDLIWRCLVGSVLVDRVGSVIEEGYHCIYTINQFGTHIYRLSFSTDDLLKAVASYLSPNRNLPWPFRQDASKFLSGVRAPTLCDGNWHSNAVAFPTIWAYLSKILYVLDLFSSWKLLFLTLRTAIPQISWLLIKSSYSSQIPGALQSHHPRSINCTFHPLISAYKSSRKHVRIQKWT